MENKHCYICKKILPLKNFYFNRAGCKKCLRIKGKEYYRTHRRERLEYKRKKGNISLRLRFEVFKRDNFTCQYCGEKAPNVKLQLDRKFPGSNGGKYTAANCITACKKCNIGKSDILLEVSDLEGL